MTTKARRLWGTKETASCMQVIRVLQSYLDGYTDELTARRVANHLDACRRCGLEASTYREIKAALRRKAPPPDQTALDRLRAFGAALAHDDLADDGEPNPGVGPPSA